MREDRNRKDWRKNITFHFGYAKYERPIRYLSAFAKSAAGCMFLVIRREFWAEDRNLGMINTFKACGVQCMTIKAVGNRYALSYIKMAVKFEVIKIIARMKRGHFALL